MGYRSDIRMIVKKETFTELEEFWFNKFEDSKDIDKVLRKELDLYQEHTYQNKQYILFGCNDRKWYESFDEVIAYAEFFEILEEREETYRYVQIGEDGAIDDRNYNGDEDMFPELWADAVFGGCLIEDDTYNLNDLIKQQIRELLNNNEITVKPDCIYDIIHNLLRNEDLVHQIRKLIDNQIMRIAGNK
jgi:hypothetical protein